MIKHLLPVLFLLIVGAAYAQDLLELEKRHGFKDIKLQNLADSVKGVKFKKEFKEKNEFDASLYTVEHPDYERIGEVKVKSIELKAYKGLIYEIQVITEKDPRLMKALESLYGKAEYDMKNETYFWKAENLVLKFKSHNKQSLELLYSSFVVHRLMKEDKKKKVGDIANDL